jgi:predicted transcriptional regulator
MAVLETQRTHKMTIELPEPIYRLLAQIADASHQSVESIAAQSVSGNLPPSVETSPAELHDELQQMQGLSKDELVAVASQQINPTQASRHMELLERNANGQLTTQERDELDSLRVAADHLMVRKAYAWALLRWRGYRIPALTELPLP